MGECSLEVLKCFHLVGTPCPRGQLFGEIQVGASNIGEEGDELLVEVTESKEKPDSLDNLRRRPLLDGLEFDWIHLYSSFSYYYPEILHFFI